MKQKVLNIIAKCALFTAKRAANSASFYGLYQPKEPVMIKKIKKES